MAHNFNLDLRIESCWRASNCRAVAAKAYFGNTVVFFGTNGSRCSPVGRGYSRGAFWSTLFAKMR
jgi:hypothetical protein